ncbi:MAG: RpiB/LacA/LacB family sugar-phosphate isomerase [Ignisphaera sp.]|nr:RpiB/LacA/LacB family sugar-phosphate isomerase [Ignisphaera sp.]MCX8167721.1 RpiB/LacA/LacB family sugar-phosphate isomerase [Ignisphaera sp.]MDW8085285.1 RpiB/LacA/LacB family sugar-phosphate isomerase [Ignisphaera sp.]
MTPSVKKVAVGSDDLYPIVNTILKYLTEKGFEIHSVGSVKSGKPEPWPLVGYEVGRVVASGEADWGIAICYTGTGVSIAANKVRGVRAAICNDPGTARGARLWNDANVLVMSSRLVSDYLAKEILDAWISVTSIDESEARNIEILKSLDACLQPSTTKQPNQ